MALTGVFPVDCEGAQFEATHTTAQFSPGTVCHDNLGGHWEYVKANEAITVYSVVHISAAATPLIEMTEITDMNTGAKKLGVAQVAFAQNEYGWVWRGPGGGTGRGIKVRSANQTAGALSFPLAGTPGAIDDANVDEGVIAGLVTLTTTTTEANVECFATTMLSCNLGETD